MAETCRAAVFLGDETYEVRELRVPDPPPGGALLMAHTLTSISIRRAIPRLRPHVGGSA